LIVAATPHKNKGETHAAQARGVAHPRAQARGKKALGGGQMLFVWTPQRIRIVVYFFAAYLALC
jgi:hypothetical protein